VSASLARGEESKRERHRNGAAGVSNSERQIKTKGRERTVNREQKAKSKKHAGRRLRRGILIELDRCTQCQLVVNIPCRALLDIKTRPGRPKIKAERKKNREKRDRINRKSRHKNRPPRGHIQKHGHCPKKRKGDSKGHMAESCSGVSPASSARQTPKQLQLAYKRQKKTISVVSTPEGGQKKSRVVSKIRS